MENTVLSALLLLLCTLGCGGPAGEPEEVASDTTIVYLAPDGTMRVEAMPDPGTQAPGHVAGAVGSLPQALAVDASCSGASLQLWDGFNFTGRRVCLYGRGSASLGLLQRRLCSTSPPRCWQLSWYGAVRSYRAGVYSGFLRQLEVADEWFTPNTGTRPIAGAVAQQAAQVFITDP